MLTTAIMLSSKRVQHNKNVMPEFPWLITNVLRIKIWVKYIFDVSTKLNMLYRIEYTSLIYTLTEAPGKKWQE